GADGQEITTTEPSTAPQGGNDNPPQGGNDEPTIKGPEADVLPSTKAEILAEYKKIMDQAKNVDKPGYTKLEYQELPKDKQDVRKGSVKMSIVNMLAGLFMTKKDKAAPEVKEKGSDMRWFPVYKATAGCLLTDASKVKSADCKKSGNNYVLTIVLNSEDNPEPAADKATSAPSATGGIFSPLSRADIDNTLVNDERVSKYIKDFDYKLTYHDCKAVLTYNPETGHIVSLEQYMYVTIVAKGDILGTAFDATAELNNVMTINKFTY
ncbi:MAG: hypothetical protein GX851_03070, partial [Clostridiales bacterium]|nr:hypothetical protein [Clostridiales bacterium]